MIDRLCLPEAIAVSTLTFAELVNGLFAAEHDLKRKQRGRHLRRMEVRVEALAFDVRCARAFGPVSWATRCAGRKPRGSRVVDLMIAATALAHDLPLYTMNAKDLYGLENLIEIIDVGI